MADAVAHFSSLLQFNGRVLDRKEKRIHHLNFKLTVYVAQCRKIMQRRHLMNAQTINADLSVSSYCFSMLIRMWMRFEHTKNGTLYEFNVIFVSHTNHSYLKHKSRKNWSNKFNKCTRTKYITNDREKKSENKM